MCSMKEHESFQQRLNCIAKSRQQQKMRPREQKFGRNRIQILLLNQRLLLITRHKPAVHILFVWHKAIRRVLTNSDYSFRSRAQHRMVAPFLAVLAFIFGRLKLAQLLRVVLFTGANSINSANDITGLYLFLLPTRRCFFRSEQISFVFITSREHPWDFLQKGGLCLSYPSPFSLTQELLEGLTVSPESSIVLCSCRKSCSREAQHDSSTTTNHYYYTCMTKYLSANVGRARSHYRLACPATAIYFNRNTVVMHCVVDSC